MKSYWLTKSVLTSSFVGKLNKKVHNIDLTIPWDSGSSADSLKKFDYNVCVVIMSDAVLALELRVTLACIIWAKCSDDQCLVELLII